MTPLNPDPRIILEAFLLALIDLAWLVAFISLPPGTGRETQPGDDEQARWLAERAREGVAWREREVGR